MHAPRTVLRALELMLTLSISSISQLLGACCAEQN
jgi:hypothetical protein